MPRLQKSIAGSAELSGVLAYNYLNLAKHYGLASKLSPEPVEFFNLFDSPGNLPTSIIYQLIDVSPLGKSLVAESLSRLSPSTWTTEHSSFWTHLVCNTTDDDGSDPATVTINRIAQLVLTDGATNPNIWSQLVTRYSPPPFCRTLTEIELQNHLQMLKSDRHF
ncbi:hypothetical protein EBR57_04035 [bacterium]|nr:hypothetical protein [bacterium]